MTDSKVGSTASVGQCYLDRRNNDILCVIAIDEAERLIDIRDEYGDVDEFDFDEWEAMDLELCSSAEDESSLPAEFSEDQRLAANSPLSLR